MKLTQKRGPLIQDLLKNKQLLRRAIKLGEGPVQVLIPEQMKHNIRDLLITLEDLGLRSRVMFAHKSSRSNVFALQAAQSEIGIDVASREELISALSAGFRGRSIECTGPKNTRFLRLALQHECLISCDSLLELETIENLGVPAQILLRISDPRAADRSLKVRASRFGILQEDVPKAYEMFKRSPQLSLQGFHIHTDERAADVKAGFLENMISLMEQSYIEGFSPSIINIGGGLRTQTIEDIREWEHYVSFLEEAIIERKNPKTWRNFTYGLALNQKGRISGREKIQGKMTTGSATTVLQEMFENRSLRERTLSEIIRENMWTVMTEPGSLLLQQAGITLVEVIGVKSSTYGPIILCDANMYNLSIQMHEMFLDPVLLSDEPEHRFEGFLMGNLCREEDILMKRKVAFSRVPKQGDIICFLNTASYGDFEDSNPHKHPSLRKLVAVKNDDWTLVDEAAYDPW